METLKWTMEPLNSLQYQLYYRIFRTCLVISERAAALQLALLLLSFIAILVAILERQSRNRQRFKILNPVVNVHRKRYVLL
jgi:ABC-type Fe3+ transport system permease subunit